jgi:hypothetical protein
MIVVSVHFLVGYWCSGLLHSALYSVPWRGGSYGQIPPVCCREPRRHAGQNHVRTRGKHTMYVGLCLCTNRDWVRMCILCIYMYILLYWLLSWCHDEEILCAIQTVSYLLVMLPSFSLRPPPLSLLSSATRPAHHRFYVYCKSPCNAMRPGKLRVRCADCKDTSFVLLGVSYRKHHWIGTGSSKLWVNTTLSVGFVVHTKDTLLFR